MEEKGLGPLIFIAGLITGAGIFKARRFFQSSFRNAKVFFAEKKERLEDIIARSKAIRLKTRLH